MIWRNLVSLIRILFCTLIDRHQFYSIFFDITGLIAAQYFMCQNLTRIITTIWIHMMELPEMAHLANTLSERKYMAFKNSRKI